MVTSQRLAPGDREFFGLVAQTAVCNPFTEERARLDGEIVGRVVSPLSEDHLEEMMQVISGRLAKLEGQGLASLRRFSEPDRGLMQTVFLFEIYHQFYRDFDQLILDQVRLET